MSTNIRIVDTSLNHYIDMEANRMRSYSPAPCRGRSRHGGSYWFLKALGDAGESVGLYDTTLSLALDGFIECQRGLSLLDSSGPALFGDERNFRGGGRTSESAAQLGAHAFLQCRLWTLLED